MIEYITGKISELTPASAVIECNGIGYFLNISLTTYSALSQNTATKLFVYESIREDARERDLFLLLISVSGVGPNTARMILSSLSAPELEQVIVSENVNILKSVKGIGAKTAQRIIVDLKDKIKPGDNTLNISMPQNQEVQDEAVAALVMLGFPQTASMKVVQKLLNESPTLKVEAIIKAALKML